MKREAGYYYAKRKKYNAVETVYFNGTAYWSVGVLSPYHETEFHWIDDKPITLKVPSIKMIIDSWYLFTDGVETMVGQYKHDDSLGGYMKVCIGVRFSVDLMKILAGPFTVEELVNMKPL